MTLKEALILILRGTDRIFAASLGVTVVPAVVFMIFSFLLTVKFLINLVLRLEEIIKYSWNFPYSLILLPLYITFKLIVTAVKLLMSGVQDLFIALFITIVAAIDGLILGLRFGIVESLLRLRLRLAEDIDRMDPLYTDLLQLSEAELQELNQPVVDHEPVPNVTEVVEKRVRLTPEFIEKVDQWLERIAQRKNTPLYKENQQSIEQLGNRRAQYQAQKKEKAQAQEQDDEDQAQAQGWVDRLDKLHRVLSREEELILFDVAMIGGEIAKPIMLVKYYQNSTGVWCYLPGSARVTCKNIIQNTHASQSNNSPYNDKIDEPANYGTYNTRYNWYELTAENCTNCVELIIIMQEIQKLYGKLFTLFGDLEVESAEKNNAVMTPAEPAPSVSAPGGPQISVGSSSYSFFSLAGITSLFSRRESPQPRM